jgi:hypothetical protein
MIIVPYQNQVGFQLCIFQPSPCSLGLSATSQQYYSLRTNQPPATSQQYSSLRTNQHQPSATSQPNRLHTGGFDRDPHACEVQLCNPANELKNL